MNTTKAKVMILGTFHLADETGLDSEKRQAEINEVVAKLAQFRPTKIALEMVPEEGEVCQDQYSRYQQGTYELEMNEYYQLGFRLANQLGHSQLYPVDWMGEADREYGEVDAWAREHQPELLEEMLKDLSFPALTPEKGLLSYYQELNEPVFLRQVDAYYLNVARIGTISNNVGIDWLSWWYKRNLIQFANLTRLADSPDERILFIVGASHVRIVENFLRESGSVEVVWALDYLKS